MCEEAPENKVNSQSFMKIWSWNVRRKVSGCAIVLVRFHVVKLRMCRLCKSILHFNVRGQRRANLVVRLSR